MEISQLTQELKEKIGNKWIPGELGDFGSCQYDPVYEWYIYILNYLRYNRTEFEEKFSVSYTSQDDILQYIAALRVLAMEEFELDMRYYEEKGKDEGDDEPQEPNIKSIEDYFEYTRDEAWDLWSASVNPLNGFECTPVKTEGYSIGVMINDMIAEDDSFITGLQLAYITFLFGTKESTFEGFCT